MQWDPEELSALRPFVDYCEDYSKRKRRLSWQERATMWANRFGKHRSGESLRGKYNQMKWGWTPKQRQSTEKKASTLSITRVGNGKVKKPSRRRTSPESSTPIPPPAFLSLPIEEDSGNEAPVCDIEIGILVKKVMMMVSCKFQESILTTALLMPLVLCSDLRPEKNS